MPLVAVQDGAGADQRDGVQWGVLEERLHGPVTLAELDAERREGHGGKAVGLARLLEAGFPVPAGFALVFEPGETSPLGDTERAAILDAWRTLVGEEPAGAGVAVRSSAAEEDGTSASLAGQHETVLDVRDGPSVIDAVVCCARSQGARRAAAYRDEMGVERGGMGVVVQRMVDAAFAGVCFTRAPDHEDQIVIEVVRGLGEALVSGRANPARFSLTRSDLEASGLEDPDGIVEAFGRDAILEVARLALRAESCFGTPLDIEWAHDGRQLYLLQARPITALDLDERRSLIRDQEVARIGALAGDGVHVWSDFSVADMFGEAVPLTVDAFQRMSLYDGGIGRSARRIGLPYSRHGDARHLFESICGRSYIDVTRFASSTVSALPLRLDDRGFVSGEPDAFDPSDPALRIDWRSVGKILALPWTLARLLAVVPWRFLALRRSFHTEYTTMIYPALVEEAAQARAEDLPALSLDDLGVRFRTLFARLVREIVYYHQVSDILSMATRNGLVRCLRLLYGKRAGEVEIALTTGLDGNFNTETNLALADVAAGASTLGPFLDEYGHRGHPDWQFSAPRWREEPHRVERLVERLADSDRDAAAQFERQRAVRRRAEQQLHEDLGRRWWSRPWRSVVLGELAHYQRYSPLREVTQSACFLFVELIRRVLLEAGAREGGADLLFFLRSEEIDAFFQDSDRGVWIRKARSRRRRLRLARSIHVPHVVRSDRLDLIGQEPEIEVGSDALSGVVACTGTVSGLARVVDGLDGAEDLQPGEILVARSTDPAWTPLFLIAGGLVLEQGGMLSHGAIVARELGLPAVVSVAGATRAIRTGQEVTVDGASGRVIVAGRP